MMNLKKWLSEFIKRLLVGGLSIKEALQLQKLNLMAKIKALINGAVIDGVKPDLTALFNRAKQYLQTTAHTWANTVSNGVLSAWGKNRVSGWRHISVLDSKTSAVCAVRHGKLWDKKHQPIGHDWVFHVPPLHPNCRSMLVPASLDEPFEGITGDDWVNSRSLKELQEQFGMGIGQMLHDGTISLHDAVRQGGLVPMTLKELQRKYPQGWEVAKQSLPMTKQAAKVKITPSQQQAHIESWLGANLYRRIAGELENPRIKKLVKQYGLTQAEAVVLRHYTGTGYLHLNSYLNGKLGDIPEIANSAEVMRSALAKLPNHKGMVVRRTNLPPQLLAIHTKNKIVEYPAFSSATFGGSDVIISESPHRLIIHSKRAKQINWISYYDESELEVLFNSPSRFKVIGNPKLVNGLIEIELEELD